MAHMLSGCSFTDPQWQSAIPWSVQYSQKYPSHIVANAGMGIRGICTETLRYLKELPDVDKLILILPTLWRMDIEMDEESYLCNAMVDRLWAENGTWRKDFQAKHKWIISGGFHYNKNTEQGKIFDSLYKHQGYLVMLKEHVCALKMLLDYCKSRNIPYYISAIQDPLDQMAGLDYISNRVELLLDEVEYKNWFRFDGKFIDKFLKHSNHPTTKEHQLLCKYIFELTN